MSVRIHDTKRCPECDTLGTIDSIETREQANYDARTQRAKKRIYECPECSEQWEFYV